MSATCLRFPLLLALAALLAACGRDRPDHIPAPAPGLLSRLDDGCPDLAGHYRLVDGQGRRIGFPGRQFGALMTSVPRHHSVWSIESLDAQRMVLRTDAGAQDMREGFAHWRMTRPHQARSWRERALAGGPGAVVAAPETSLPRTRRYTLAGALYRCGDGWLVIGGLPDRHSEAPDPWEVRITRAADGGLVAVRRERVKRSFSIWCGDGCWPDIPLPDGEREVWWHAAPAPPADAQPVDWAALAAEVPPAPTTQAALGAPVDARQGAAPPAMPVVGQAPTSPPVEPAPADAAYWHQRLAPLLPGGTRIDPVECQGRRCVLAGSAVAMADVSQLMRAIHDDGAGMPELEIIEKQADARYRFRMVLAQPG